MSWLVGHTGISFFDYWALAHLSFWFFLGSTLAALRVKFVFGILCSLSAALSWEIFERFAEKLWPTVWLSPESWWNAWCSDLLTVSMVALAYYGYAKWRPK